MIQIIRLIGFHLPHSPTRISTAISVHFDSDEAIAAAPAAVSPDLDKVENGAIAGGSGRGFQGFYFFYWQNSC